MQAVTVDPFGLAVTSRWSVLDGFVQEKSKAERQEQPKSQGSVLWSSAG